MVSTLFMSKNIKLYSLFFIILVCQIAFSSYMRPLRAVYEVVPYPVSQNTASLQYLGDKELAYRMYGIMIQNFGDTAGNHTALKDYDFERLSKWFFLEHELNSKSNFIPFLASYYFGSSQEPEKIGPVIDYLQVAGKEEGAQKWRWLAHAVYLARFRMKDNDRALELAYDLSDLYKSGMPAWTKQMPAFVNLNMGDKKAAYLFMLELLKSESDNMHPNEVNFMVDYICKRTLTSDQSREDPLCAEFQ